MSGHPEGVSRRAAVVSVCSPGVWQMRLGSPSSLAFFPEDLMSFASPFFASIFPSRRLALTQQTKKWKSFT